MAGGCSVELLKLYNLRHLPKDERPSWLYSAFYWGVTVAMIAAGGGLVFLYIASDLPMKAIVAFNIGASAPLALKEGLQALDKPKTSDKDVHPN